MKAKLWMLLIILVVTILSACAGIRSVTVFESAPKHGGKVKIRLHPQISTADPLFQMLIHTDRAGGMPPSDLLKEIKIKAANLGANVLVFKCGSPGTVGQSTCNATGYFEKQ